MKLVWPYTKTCGRKERRKGKITNSAYKHNTKQNINTLNLALIQINNLPLPENDKLLNSRKNLCI